MELGRPGALASLPLNSALLRSGAGAERVQKSNERSREESGGQITQAQRERSGTEREVVGAKTER